MDTWLIILIVSIGIILLAGLGVGLYFLFRPKTPPENGGNNNGGEKGGSNKGGSNGGGSNGGGSNGGGGAGTCKTPLLQSVSRTDFTNSQGNNVGLFTFIFNDPSYSSSSMYSLELSSNQFSTMYSAGGIKPSWGNWGNNSISCSSNGACTIVIDGGQFGSSITSPGNFSARMMSNCGSGQTSNIVQVTGQTSSFRRFGVYRTY